MKKIAPILIIVLFVFGSCQKNTQNKNLLALALASEKPAIKRVMDSVAQYEVQIRYTKINRSDDSIHFEDYDFNVADDTYFYPASTVKLPVAVMALERLNETDTLTRETTYYVEGDTIESTFARDVSQIFAVSDNLANNRLVEFLGQDAINKGLEEKGLFPIRIAHRLGYHTDELMTKPLIIYLNDSTTTPTTPSLNTSPKPLKLNSVQKGIAYYENEIKVAEPFNFSLKNYYPINTQHNLLKRIIFPEKFSQKQRFNLSNDQRNFLLEAMHTLPKNAGYNPKEYYDGYCKFFMYGDTKDKIPAHIKIYNKVGFAYGTLTDCAYIKDEKNNVDFMITATILVNKDGIFNDDVYEYDEIGIPFLAELGRELHRLEIER